MTVPVTRRQLVTSASCVAAAAAIGLPVAARADTVDVAELMKPSTLGDIYIGPDTAPVTIVEYASMTCNHCAAFTTQVLPKIKERYIDTGKVRYVLREFPLDPLAAGAFMLARCAGKDKYYAMVDTLFHQFGKWVVQNPIPPLLAIAKQAGFTQQTFEACLQDQKLLDGLDEIRKRGSQQFKVESTPTFFVNGERVVGAVPFEEFAKIIDRHLKA
ncbi:Disulfide bond formation protein D [Rhodoplanes serenus]|uniref:Disulfide bond formation protein D n=1 Tax=Rhodoplanes serenus TaxID=200615 RepID=A0A447D2I9_9BRAD|nr:DsbA family protein [Rhodoplanes serenus]VCU11732.1 Disulfide bond formation protein D [Rhodoplanes serenus]